ncbi:hypothetical protein ES703_53912 [subsurface metagenome]
MKIPCFRCGKGLETPDSSNADYVIAKDTVVREPRETLIALKHNQATLTKEAKMKERNPDGILKYPTLTIGDSEYDTVEIPNIEASKSIGEDLVKVIAEIRGKDIQKTGIICPNCYRPTDFVIWGVHKEKAK